MNKVEDLLEKYSTGKILLILFLITQFLYFIILLVSIPYVMQYSDSMKLLDMMPTGYDIEYGEKLFETLGEKGRYAYLFIQIPIDLIYPAFFIIAYR